MLKIHLSYLLMPFILIIGILIVPKNCIAQWHYDWNTRIDQDGKPAGIYSTPPIAMQVDKDSTEYKVVNDENLSGKTFTLGTKVYVDGPACIDTCNNGDMDYSPTTRTCGSGSDKVYNTIPNALSSIGEDGNYTVLVRAGIYNVSTDQWQPNRSGTDETHPFSVIGYGTERPIIDMQNNESIVFSIGSSDYVTIQRLRIQNSGNRGIVATAGSDYLKVFDVDFYNNCNTAHSGATAYDAHIHVFGNSSTACTYPWIYHCTFKRSYNKGIKVADNSDNAIIEWNVIDESGYWEGITNTPSGHAYGIDMAADGTEQNNSDAIIRYNIVGSALMGNELRYCPNFSVHHNEFYDSVHVDDFSDEQASYDHIANFMIRGSSSYGDFYSNIVRDNYDTDKSFLLTVVGQDQAVNKINIYNNLLYGTSATGYGIYLYGYVGDGDDRKITVYNNSLYGSTNKALMHSIRLDSGDDVIVKNNILYQTGVGNCIDFDALVTSDYNRYYFPSGSLGGSPSANDEDEKAPNWISNPSGAWSPGEAEAKASMDGVYIATVTTDKNEVLRDNLPDKGWDEYITPPSSFRLTP
jgi:hypothetical protein